MTFWAAIGAAAIGAGAGIYGARKNADAIEAGSDQAAAVQREALRTNLALSRPQLEVGTGALGILASLYGIAPPTPIDFDNLAAGSGGGSDYRGGLRNAENDPVVLSYRNVLGRDPDPGGYQYYSQLVAEKGLRLDDLEAMHRTGDEYREKQAAGTLPPTELGGEFSQNYQGLRLVETPEANAAPAAGATPGAGLNLNDLVANNPLIRFNREQGEQAIARGAAARGLNQSGGTLRDLSRFNQDLAGAGVQNFVLNPLFELAGFGPRAAAQMGGAVTTTGTNLGNLALGAANARGSAYQNAGNMIGNLAGSFADYAMYRDYMGNPGGSESGGNSGGGGSIRYWPGAPSFLRGGND